MWKGDACLERHLEGDASSMHSLYYSTVREIRSKCSGLIVLVMLPAGWAHLGEKDSRDST